MKTYGPGGVVWREHRKNRSNYWMLFGVPPYRLLDREPVKRLVSMKVHQQPKLRHVR